MKWPVNKINAAYRAYKVLTHQDAIRIVNYIGQKEPVTVGKIYRTLKLEQSHCSQRLRFLRQAGLVTCERYGKNIMYSINYERFEKLKSILPELCGKAKTKDAKKKPIGVIDANLLAKW